MSGIESSAKAPFLVFLRDNNEAMVSAWKDSQAFGSQVFEERVKAGSKYVGRLS